MALRRLTLIEAILAGTSDLDLLFAHHTLLPPSAQQFATGEVPSEIVAL